MVRSSSKSRVASTPSKKVKQGKMTSPSSGHKRRNTVMHSTSKSGATPSSVSSPSHHTSKEKVESADPCTPTKQVGSPRTGPHGFHSPAPLRKSADSARRQLQFTTVSNDEIPKSPPVEDKLAVMKLGSVSKTRQNGRGVKSPQSQPQVQAIRRSRRIRKEEDEDRAPVFAPSAFVVNTVSTACTAIGNGLRKFTTSLSNTPTATEEVGAVIEDEVSSLEELEDLEEASLSASSGIARFDSDEEDEIVDYSDPYNWIASFRPKFLEAKAQKILRPILPARTKTSPKITLVLDLDETLVHSSTMGGEQLPNTTRFHVNFCDQVYTVDAGIRPHAEKFIQEVGKIFEVVVFTASMKVYADEICRILDPSSQLIKQRLYREHCLFYDPNYLKDLDILGRDPRQVIIVDNLIQAFALQLDNGIPIPDWRNDNPYDDELLKILDFLKSIKDVDDVRPHIRKRWRISQHVKAADAKINGLPRELTAKAA